MYYYVVGLIFKDWTLIMIIHVGINGFKWLVKHWIELINMVGKVLGD